MFKGIVGWVILALAASCYSQEQRLPLQVPT